MARRQRLVLPSSVPVEELRERTDPAQTFDNPYPDRARSKRHVIGRVPQISNLDTARAFIGSIWYLNAVDLLNRAMGEGTPMGRPRQYGPADWVLHWVIQWGYWSRRTTFRETASVWHILYEYSCSIWPEGSPYRLSPQPISPTAWYRIRREYIDLDPVLAATFDDSSRKTNCEFSTQIGLFDGSSGSRSRPSPLQMMAGDSTLVDSPRNPVTVVDPDTGEITTSCPDPAAYPKPGGEGKWGRAWASVLARTDYGGERVILAIAPVPEGPWEGTVATDLAIALKEHYLSEARGLVFDMHLFPVDQERLLENGLIPGVKTPRHGDKTGRGPHQANLGKQRFTRRDGSPVELNTYTVDGAPCLRFPVQGRPVAVFLSGHQIVWRFKLCYRYWSVPDDPAVPAALRGARVLLRHNSTAKERAAGHLRTSHLKVIPESDPQFARLHGRRQDTESMHADLKPRLIGKRARSLGLQRQQLDMTAWTIFNNLRAALSYQARTGSTPPALLAHAAPSQAQAA